MKILKAKQQMYSLDSNVFYWSLPVFTVVTVMSVWTHCNYDSYEVKICTLLISFYSETAKWKKNWIKESAWIFLTKLYHYHLSEDIKILCMHFQKRSQQYTEEKNILKMWKFKGFLRS